jgi:hypothetical protein
MIVKICVTPQPFVLGTPPVTITVAGLQVSFVEDTAACTLANVGTLVGLQPKFAPTGTPLNTGAVVFAVQVLVTYAVAVLPQALVAMIVKICVTAQTFVLGTPPVTCTVAGLHASLAVTAACTLANVGTLAGLQPKFLPAGTPLSTGAVVSAVQVLVTFAVAVLPQPSVATMVKICVSKQPLVVITLVWLIDAVPQASLALSPGMLEGTLAGLQP